MAFKSYDIPDLGKVTIYKRRGVRYIRVSVTHEGTVRVSMPSWSPYAAGLAFVQSKKSWILEKMPKKMQLQHGLQVGKAHRMVFVEDQSARTIKTRINGTEIRITIPAGMTTNDKPVQQAAARAAMRALKTEAIRLLPQRLKTLAEKHDFNYKSVTIKSLKTRWGSCTSEKDISLNLYLMQLPWELIDYVLLHELTHTKVMEHGPRFWDEMARHVENLKGIRKEMRLQRPTLQDFSAQ